MSDRPGWVKLYNQTLDSDFWLSDEPFDWRSAFLHVLMAANWRDGVVIKDGHPTTIHRGQWLTSIRKLESTFHWSRTRVENWLEGMADYGMITTESLRFGTVLTIVNYEKYQSSPDRVEHTVEHTVEHAPEHTVEHTVEQRSKTIDIRQQTEDSIFAPAEQPDEEDPEDADLLTPDQLKEVLLRQRSTSQA